MQWSLEGACRPPAGRQAPCLPVGGRGAAGSLQGPLHNFFLFTYRSLPPTYRTVGPLPPLAGRQGYRTVKPKTKNIFLYFFLKNTKIKKTPDRARPVLVLDAKIQRWSISDWMDWYPSRTGLNVAWRPVNLLYRLSSPTGPCTTASPPVVVRTIKPMMKRNHAASRRRRYFFTAVGKHAFAVSPWKAT